ncbi:hypothetical protein FXO37_25919 [Capsicum annuum]|nr:hypothetical protein FXO37_25919 [Capsicum annuum]
MLDSMKYQVYQRKSMYRCGGFPLAFQCWFYECCPYANDKLVVRVGDSVPRVLNWSVTIRPNYRKVQFAFNDINCEQLRDEVLSMKQLMTSSFDLIFKALHINKGSKSAEYHSGQNMRLKNNNTHAGNPIGVNLSDNVGRKTDGTSKVDHVSDNVVDVAGDHLSDNVVDDIGKETVGVGDRIDTDASDRPITVSNFTQLISQENVQFMKDLVENSQKIDWSVVLNSEISKYTQPNKIDEHSVIEKAIEKINTDLGCTSVALEATEVLINVGSVRKNIDDTSVGDKSTFILDDTPVVPHRIRKPARICESPYVSKFDSGCSNVQGQPTKCIDKGPSRKHIFSIKHPFTINITEPFLDMKLLSSFNKFVDKSLRLNSNPIYLESVNNLANAFDFGVVTIKTKEWFYTLGYAGVPLTDSFLGKRKDVAVIKEDSEIVEYILRYVMRCVAEKVVSAYSELLPNLLSSIDFWDKRSDGIEAADSFDIRMVDGLPTQKNT